MNRWGSLILPYFILALIQFIPSPAGPLYPLPAYNRLPCALFGPVHFTKYSLKPEFQNYTPDYVSRLHPSARKFILKRYYQGGPLVPVEPYLF